MKTARRYTTKPIKGGIAFKCVQCEYSVTTLDFQNKDGNTRTQAATAVNEHACLCASPTHAGFIAASATWVLGAVRPAGSRNRAEQRRQ